ncbi:hypothetical protein CLIB1444_01S05138 [[Candida] jaroonii]|uniref:Uncharacterized protein n=1 Tax=[Candida] jaroonii TaxID=467808 RepID=A0ACA9Y0R6_9ASCO|nr:hypothetical protein CLIB1444_01S05138 [[Candida] jaroonii]
MSYRVLTLDDVPKAAVTLVEAFTEDALAKLITCHIHDKKKRVYCETLLYEAYLRQHILTGLVIGCNELSDKFETVAMWSLPDSMEKGLETFSTLMKSGYQKVWEVVEDEGREKVFEGMLPLLHDTCERIMSTDVRFKHKNLYTLVYLGSTREARGKGNVRRMFDYMFDKYIDQDPNSLAYLESSSPSNIPIYNKFGFFFYEDIMLGEKGPGAIEGTDYAIMNVMIRSYKGLDWQKIDSASEQQTVSKL